jgi:hypothetical protein
MTPPYTRSMRFRVWHVLALMAFLAMWMPLSQGLLALEAKDHPAKPQSALDVVGFYAGTATMLGALIVLIVAAGFAMRRWRRALGSNGEVQAAPGDRG